MEMIKDSIDGKAMVLFGSFGWGDSAYIEDLEKNFNKPIDYGIIKELG